jgi:hypothetical protein
MKKKTKKWFIIPLCIIVFLSIIIGSWFNNNMNYWKND